MSSIRAVTEPVEIWLSQVNSLTVTCQVVHQDETTEYLDVDSLSLRGAMREITGYLLAIGYEPVDRWETVADHGDDSAEAVRRFKPDTKANVTVPPWDQGH
jgi:hypothetical protein